jgi:glyoxylase-like metal-dependent hydrolase (beta-lactamase superfamily II)
MSIDKTLYNPVNRYDVQEIGKNVYKINEYNLTTMFLVVGERRALAIDCGTGVGDYRAVIEGITKLPFDLVITHGHVDHIGGRGQFEKMFISEEDQPLISTVTVSERKKFLRIMRYLMGFKVIKVKDAKIESVKKEPELAFIKEGDVFDLGGKTVKVFHTPAHTRGSLCFLAVEDKILFSGDVVNPQNLMQFPESTTVEEMRDALIKVKNLGGYDTIWAAHLSKPISSETLENGIKCADKILKRKNGLPFIGVSSYKGYLVLYKQNKRRKAN